MHHVYLLRCADGSIYTGSCRNLAERIHAHQRGEGAGWTAARWPVVLIHSESYPTVEGAIARERQLKGWTRAKKAALAAGDGPALRSLARRTGARTDPDQAPASRR